MSATALVDALVKAAEQSGYAAGNNEHSNAETEAARKAVLAFISEGVQKSGGHFERELNKDYRKTLDAIGALVGVKYGPESLIAAVRDRVDYAELLSAPARELLFLYDWRPAIAEMEKDPDANPKTVARVLREYGERKKAGWIALRAVLAQGYPGSGDPAAANSAALSKNTPTTKETT